MSRRMALSGNFIYGKISPDTNDTNHNFAKMKSESSKGRTPEIYESPEILKKDIITEGLLCASPIEDYGSLINDVKQEEEDFFDFD